MIEKANMELRNIYEWFKANRLAMNISKTFYIVFHKAKHEVIDNLPLTVDGLNIEQHKSAKFLGMTIDSHLNWQE